MGPTGRAASSKTREVPVVAGSEALRRANLATEESATYNRGIGAVVCQWRSRVNGQAELDC